MINQLILENKPNLNIETYAGALTYFPYLQWDAIVTFRWLTLR